MPTKLHALLSLHFSFIYTTALLMDAEIVSHTFFFSYVKTEKATLELKKKEDKKYKTKKKNQV